MELQKIKNSISQSVTLKLLSIFFLTIILMIPNAMIKDLIRERSNRKAQVETEVERSYGSAQTIGVPVINVPYTVERIAKDGTAYTNEGIISISPDKTEIDGEIMDESRKRSIYEVIVYQSTINIEQRFELASLDLSDLKDYQLDYDHAFLTFFMSDVKGLGSDQTIKVNGKEIKMKGLMKGERINAYVESEKFSIKAGESLDIISQLNIKGTRSLSFEPIGNEFTVDLSSTYPHPSFIGNALPDSHDVSDAGFTSRWTANKFSHAYAGYSRGIEYGKLGSTFGVNLIQPVDGYAKNLRTAKYALLIIALTFGTFFLFEALNNKKIHVVQYLLVGFALTIFFLLLIAITEHLGFDVAYFLSSVATIGLITSYISFVLKSRKSTMVLLALLIGLFGYIFVILQLIDYALLAGALALFALLAIIMMVSRNVDWSDLRGHGAEEQLIY